MNRFPGSPQFLEVNEFGPRLGSSNNCAFWDPVYPATPQTPGARQQKVWQHPSACRNLLLTIPADYDGVSTSSEYDSQEEQDSGYTSIGLNPTADDLTNYIHEFSYSPRRVCADRQLEIIRRHESVLGSFAVEFVQQMTVMGCKADELKTAAREMRSSARRLSRNFIKLEQRTSKLLTKVRGLQMELSDVLYLNQLIHILNGETQHMVLHNWPFVMALEPGRSPAEYNLVV